MAKVEPKCRTYYEDLHSGKLNIAELHVDMNRLMPMYFLHHVERWITRLMIFVSICLGIILLIIFVVSMKAENAKEVRAKEWSNALFWGTFFIMILSLCGNFVSDRKDKSIMPYVNDYIEHMYPDKCARPTPKNVLRNGHIWETLWHGMSPREEKYFIDADTYRADLETAAKDKTTQRRVAVRPLSKRLEHIESLKETSVS